MKNLVLLASGSGSNVENIYKYFADKQDVTIQLVLSNKTNAKVIDRCNRLGIPCMTFNNSAFSKTDTVLELLKKLNPDIIILAGFIKKIPYAWIEYFRNKIINIHPALLPRYGGKGMYGMYVHQAICTNKDSKTGITIHYVNENYDEGAIIFQKSVGVSPSDSAEDIAAKVQELEYLYYPKIIEELLYAD